MLGFWGLGFMANRSRPPSRGLAKPLYKSREPCLRIPLIASKVSGLGFRDVLKS